MDQEQRAINARLSALSFLVQEMLAKIIASHATPEAGEAFVASLHRATRRADRFVADDDQHLEPISRYAEEIQEQISSLVDQAERHSRSLKQHAPGSP
jgi:hypothetical protein